MSRQGGDEHIGGGDHETIAHSFQCRTKGVKGIVTQIIMFDIGWWENGPSIYDFEVTVGGEILETILRVNQQVLHGSGHGSVLTPRAPRIQARALMR